MTTNPIDSARQTIALEAQGLKALSESLDENFTQAVQMILALGKAKAGRVIISGMGKSGHVGNKIAATLASTGTPAQFVHAAEASHGDLGMITKDDIIIALSWSGETAELASLINYALRFTIPLIAITSDKCSLLGSNAQICLTLPKIKEACPNGAPTTSTTMQIALGDALAVALLTARGFGTDDFRNFHPGGKLGATLNQVRALMHKEDKLPLVPAATLMSEALLTITQKGLGCVGITDNHGLLTGIITDGDLRRNMTADLLEKTAQDIMTPAPKTIAPDNLAGEALAMMHTHKIQCLFVCEDGKPVGLVRFLDLLDSGVA